MCVRLPDFVRFPASPWSSPSSSPPFVARRGWERGPRAKRTHTHTRILTRTHTSFKLPKLDVCAGVVLQSSPVPVFYDCLVHAAGRPGAAASSAAASSSPRLERGSSVAVAPSGVGTSHEWAFSRGRPRRPCRPCTCPWFREKGWAKPGLWRPRFGATPCRCRRVGLGGAVVAALCGQCTGEVLE